MPTPEGTPRHICEDVIDSVWADRAHQITVTNVRRVTLLSTPSASELGSWSGGDESGLSSALNETCARVWRRRAGRVRTSSARTPTIGPGSQRGEPRSAGEHSHSRQHTTMSAAAPPSPPPRRLCPRRNGHRPCLRRRRRHRHRPPSLPPSHCHRHCHHRCHRHRPLSQVSQSPTVVKEKDKKKGLTNARPKQVHIPPPGQLLEATLPPTTPLGALLLSVAPVCLAAMVLVAAALLLCCGFGGWRLPCCCAVVGFGGWRLPPTAAARA
jgi:hypothetical protein